MPNFSGPKERDSKIIAMAIMPEVAKLPIVMVRDCLDASDLKIKFLNF